MNIADVNHFEDRKASSVMHDIRQLKRSLNHYFDGDNRSLAHEQLQLLEKSFCEFVEFQKLIAIRKYQDADEKKRISCDVPVV